MSIATQMSGQVNLSDIEDKLCKLSTDKLKVRFYECQRTFLTHLAEAAICVKLLKDRGEPLSEIPGATIFLRIAEGRIAPELVTTFMESPSFNEVEKLPVSDQKKIAANPMVPVVEGKTTRMVDLRTAPRAVVKQVITPTGIRTPDEQRAHLAIQKTQPAAKPTPAKEVPSEPLTRSVTIKLTDSELAAIKVRAAKAGNLDTAAMLRRYLLQTDAFKMPK